MTVQFNEERYQSDRLTFERQQFEEAFTKRYGVDGMDAAVMLMRDPDNQDVYMVGYTGAAWTGWKLSKGLL